MVPPLSASASRKLPEQKPPCQQAIAGRISPVAMLYLSLQNFAPGNSYSAPFICGSFLFVNPEEYIQDRSGCPARPRRWRIPSPSDGFAEDLAYGERPIGPGCPPYPADDAQRPS